MKQARLIISGFVQGVGFRYFVKRRADKLGLVGFVRNVPGGHVEAVFEGSKENIDTMIADCRKGTYLSQVSKVDYSINEITGDFKDFSIRD